MNAPLDELYLTWLYSQVGSVRTRSKERMYWNLLRKFFKTEFIWIIPNDDNRCGDGLELRYEFLVEHEIDDVDPHWMEEGCSFLEMLIGVARRLAWQIDSQPREWFWQLIENIGLQNCNDAYYDNVMADMVEQVVDKVIWRQYFHNGHGGLFPLSNPNDDQRNVEIWYQMHAYLIENDL